jgi:hypothetical protein
MCRAEIVLISLVKDETGAGQRIQLYCVPFFVLPHTLYRAVLSDQCIAPGRNRKDCINKKQMQTENVKKEHNKQYTKAGTYQNWSMFDTHTYIHKYIKNICIIFKNVPKGTKFSLFLQL